MKYMESRMMVAWEVGKEVGELVLNGHSSFSWISLEGCAAKLPSKYLFLLVSPSRASPVFIQEAALCSGWWLMQKHIIGHSTEKKTLLKVYPYTGCLHVLPRLREHGGRSGS